MRVLLSFCVTAALAVSFGAAAQELIRTGAASAVN